MKHSVIDLDSSSEWHEAPPAKPIDNSSVRCREGKMESSSNAASDTSIDLFDSPEKPTKNRYDYPPSTSTSSNIFTIDSSPEFKTKVGDNKRKHWISPRKIPSSQTRLDAFLTKSPAPKRSEFGSPRKGQLPMDLFLKWKDGNKNVRAQDERDRHFSKPTNDNPPDVRKKVSRPEADAATRPEWSDTPLMDINNKKTSSRRKNDFAECADEKSSDISNVVSHCKKSDVPRTNSTQFRNEVGSSHNEQSQKKLNERRLPENTPSEDKQWDVDHKMASIVDEQSKRARMMREMMNDSFVEKHRGGSYKKIQDDKRANVQDGDVVRRKDQRQQMHATGCSCCDGYYDLLDLSPESKKNRIQQVSRHRYVHEPMPKTPEHYWEIGFPSESEQKRRGLIKTASPKKKPSKRLF